MAFSNCSIKLLTLIVALGVIAACSKSGNQTSVAADTAMDSLVTAEWLSEHLNDPDLVVLDCTVLVQPGEDGGFSIVSGRANYEKGHIPTAGFADLMGDLSDAGSPLQFAVPTPEHFAAAMSALGVGDDSRVVLYDSSGSSAWAARVWWMLRWIGFDRAALLDGGLAAWTAQGHVLSTEPARRPAEELTIALRPELIVDKDEVLAAVGDDSVNIIDALSEAQYRGERSMYARPGHIAGASNVPMTSLLDETGRYRPLDEIDELLVGDRDTRSITYCGGGIAASANAFIMTRLGYKNVAVYTASLQEWAADASLPMEVTPDLEAISE
ncbi:MAG: sulfurtransferase [Gammaproteobacteria bacterium]|nr:sulfurtransferase [Gammaproteobacteria bacterium]MDH3372443.1 sulfurtransferase [Gammaproteobacteria bacterium]MDH3407878.1 sulfurtransferase [Gammaproteobacteria bacterium]MDH3553427.1 sulfurtransferase [Gammaproteobacteria bacterium]